MSIPRLARWTALAVSFAVIAASCGGLDRSDVRVSADAQIAASSTLVPAAVETTVTAPSTTATSTTTTTTTTTTTATTTSVAATTSTTTAPTTTTPTTTTAAPPPTTVAPSAVYNEQAYSPFAMADGVELVHPSARVELIGYHEAGHDGSKQQELLSTATMWVTLATRGRATGSRTAADIVVPPDEEIRSPVTGTVIRGGTYVLYCQYSDDFIVIEPDARPGWEVKMFHFDGLVLSVGDRVEAGVTVVAPRATRLPFESQVDEFTAEPSNPHVHVEVIDPSIPDIPSPGGGC